MNFFKSHHRAIHSPRISVFSCGRRTSISPSISMLALASAALLGVFACDHGLPTEIPTVVAPAPPSAPVPPAAPVQKDTALRILKASQQLQTGLSGSAVWSAPYVWVTDYTGKPVYGFAITCTVTGGGGHIADSVKTGDIGTICDGWVLGPTPGENTLTVTIAHGESVQFVVNAYDSSFFEIYDLQSIGGLPLPGSMNGQLWLSGDGTFAQIDYETDDTPEIFPGRFRSVADTLTFSVWDYAYTVAYRSGDLLNMDGGVWWGDSFSPRVYKRRKP